MSQIQKHEENQPLSIVEKLAMVGERPPLIKDDPEKALKVIFNGLVKTYAYLGHRNIFKGDAVQRSANKLQIEEISSQILQGFRNNAKYRRITDLDFDAVIDKGCSSGLVEIKAVSPKAIFLWVDEFLNKYLERIQRQRVEYQKLEASKLENKNEIIRKQNLEGIQALISYCEKPRTSPFTDVKQFQGYWLAKICERYDQELPDHFKKSFSKRKDLYAEAVKKAEAGRLKNEDDSKFKGRCQRLYCYKLVDTFKEAIEETGPEMYEEIMTTAINEHHDKNE